MSRVKPPNSNAGRTVEDDPRDAVDEGDLPTGTMVGEYRVDKRIGSGGMGIVYSGTHPVIGKRVAIKVLRADVCNDAVAVERFIDEARVVNQIEHPNIVDIFAFGQLPDSRHYFVMEWLRGESLRTRIERQRLTIGDVAELLIPLVRALSAAHEHGIVHRDLKPDNVFIVASRGEIAVKLLDFGVAKLSKADIRTKRVGHTATGTIVGTPQYLSPEQAKGATVDHRADIYALGAIAFEAITGEPPFVAPSVMEVVAMHLMEKPPRPSAHIGNVPFELDELVVATLAKDPDERPTLAEWNEALVRVAAQSELDARPRNARSLVATDPALMFAENTPPPHTPLPHTPTPPASTRVDVKRRPRWPIVALVAVPLIVIGVMLLTPPAASPPVASPTAPPTTSTMPQQPPSPPITPTPTPIVPAAPVELPPAADSAATSTHGPTKNVHHAAHAPATEQTTTPAVESQPTIGSDNDLLTPGSIPRDDGSASK